ncbi:MAG: hypothetical protein FWD61_18395, partial [Phycisphaerales bacterium]|nr:hypothetical protein [Phycisphaerales bacterium]
PPQRAHSWCTPHPDPPATPQTPPPPPPTKIRENTRRLPPSPAIITTHTASHAIHPAFLQIPAF